MVLLITTLGCRDYEDASSNSGHVDLGVFLWFGQGGASGQA